MGIWNRLKRLAKENEIYYFYTYDKEEEASIPELESLCMQVVSVKRRKNFNLILRMLKYPYTVASRCMPELENAIRDCVQRNKIELINIDFPHMCAAAQQTVADFAIPVVLNEHNIEWKVYQQISGSTLSLVKRMAYGIDGWRLKRYEKRMVDRLKPQGITFVSEENLKEYDAWVQPSYAKLALVPVGMEIGVQCTNLRQNLANIAFFGKMSYEPNAEGAVWFTQEIFPLIKKDIPEAKLYLVGRDPTEQVQKLACEDVIVTGTVPEVQPFYEKAGVVVIPLLHGDGVKVKLLEAISYGKQIVSTSKGVEGTDFAENGLVPVADDKHRFAELCIERIKRPESYLWEVQQVFEYCTGKYTWDAICRMYSDYLTGIGKGTNAEEFHQ